MMNIPTLAIVGRPNVGKSTLFNRFIGRKQALVYDQPGVTRDRNYAVVDWIGHSFRVVDTGGYETEPHSDLFSQMRRQVEMAIQEADLILLVVDGREGITPDDREMAIKLRKAGKNIFLAVNKIDLAEHEIHLSDFFKLGIQNTFPISAEHSRGVSDMLEEAIHFLFHSGEASQKTEESSELNSREVKVAIVGRPNVGKSTLLNRFYGAPRAVVHPEPGTTRDPLDIEVTEQGQVFRFVDTAGVRQKSHSEGKIEKVSVMKTFERIEKSHVALLLVDAQEGLTAQDGKVAQQILKRQRPLLLLANKCDLLSPKLSWKEVEKKWTERFDFLRFVSILPISAKTGQGTARLFREILKVYEQYRKHVKTADINRVFRRILEEHPPPLVSGKSLNLFYMTQVAVAPPHFVIFMNHPEKVPLSYERYLMRELRKAFSFQGTPLVLEFKGRKKKTRE